MSREEEGKSALLYPPTDEEPVHRGCCCKCCTTYKKALVLCGLMLLSGIGFAFTQPTLPHIKSKYFGSDKKAARIQSIIDCSGAFLAMFTAPLYGQMLDSFGRRPFFIAGAAVQMVTYGLLAFVPGNPLPMMIWGGAGKIVQGSYVQAFVADCFTEKRRVVAFAAVTAVGNMTAIFAMLTAMPFMTLQMDAYVAFGSSCTAVLYTIFFIKESLPQELHKPVSLKSIGNPITSLRLLLSSKVVIATVTIMSFVLLAQVGTGEIILYYLDERIGFGPKECAYAYLENGILVPIVLLVLLPLLLKCMSSVMVILLCTVALILELVMLATAWASWTVYGLSMPMLALTTMLLPTLQTILANSGTAEEQGLRMSGLTSIMDLCMALGPLFFGLVYSYSTGAWKALPFLICALFSIPIFLLAMKIQKYMKEDVTTRRMSVMGKSSAGESSAQVTSQNLRLSKEPNKEGESEHFIRDEDSKPFVA